MHLRSGVFTLIRSLWASTVAGVEAIRTGNWRQHQYQLLQGREQQRTKRIVTFTGLATAAVLTLWLLACHGNYGTLDNRSCEHPVVRLVHDASKSFNETLERQSKTFEEAVVEYHRRYKMPPPPHFDEWYTFATARNTALIDEFDTIYHTLQPFWGLEPNTIRSRAREDLSFRNFLMGAAIQNGRAMHFGSGQQDFQKDATIRILQKFSQWLPDMLLGFNSHDEPRVVVPHEDLHTLITKGYETQARLDINPTKSDSFSKGDAHDPLPPEEVFTTRFNNIERQETWLYSRLSCPPETPARSLDGNAPDNSTAFAIEPLGFIFNQTAASDMCNSPSLRHRLGVFKRPNSFKVTNELAPVFSMSRPSSFQDIAVPSPYYYEGISHYDNNTAVDWENKKPQLYWRGGTTGGHSRNGTWQQFQRQRIIGNLTHPQSPRYLLRPKSESCMAGRTEGWEVEQVTQSQIEGFFNTHFVEIKDCDDDCVEEEQFFNDIREPDPPEEAWKHRYLLDMDGHAYSGRFYAFMRSNSVPFKLTFFREWHEDILIPWVHYVPINKDGNEIPELIRFFEEDPAGRQIARSIGEEGQAWAAKTIRNDDIDVYMFRLLLE